MNDKEKNEKELLAHTKHGRCETFVYKNEDGDCTRVSIKGSPMVLIICGVFFSLVGLYAIITMIASSIKNDTFDAPILVGVFMMLIFFVGMGVFCIVFAIRLIKNKKKYKKTIEDFDNGVKGNQNKDSNEFEIEEDKFKIDPNEFSN
ncbi:MAG: hypothetical protein IJY14_04485 [Acholeplasmatales bacterium]|nr:hypothetical protein [Acholeplasmatales bacterium]